MLTEVNRRLRLDYNPGVFTFRNFVHTSSDQQLFDLATALNRFQDTPVARILKVQTFEII
jgi:hypothetical protein